MGEDETGQSCLGLVSMGFLLFDRGCSYPDNVALYNSASGLGWVPVF